MDTDEKIHIELLRRLKSFSENYVSNKSHKSQKNKNHNLSPIICPKGTLFQEFSLDDKKYLLFSSIHLKSILNSLINQLKNNHKKKSISKSKNDHRHKNSQLINNFDGKNQINKNYIYKKQDKAIKMNLVNQKFKIADNFNEKNSSQFLNEKDECLKKIILSDEIEEEKFTPFYVSNENESKHELSFIKNNEYNERDDSRKMLSELIAILK